MLFKIIKVIEAILGLGCLGYLLLDPVERNRFFLTRLLAKLFFPRLEPFHRQQKLAVLAGVTFAIVVLAVALSFFIHHYGSKI